MITRMAEPFKVCSPAAARRTGPVLAQSTRPSGRPMATAAGGSGPPLPARPERPIRLRTVGAYVVTL